LLFSEKNVFFSLLFSIPNDSVDAHARLSNVLPTVASIFIVNFEMKIRHCLDLLDGVVLGQQ
jgi:hypothetical protein